MSSAFNALAGEHLNHGNLLTFLLFPQAPFAGAAAGLIYWMSLRLTTGRGKT